MSSQESTGRDWFLTAMALFAALQALFTLWLLLFLLLVPNVTVLSFAAEHPLPAIVGVYDRDLRELLLRIHGFSFVLWVAVGCILAKLPRNRSSVLSCGRTAQVCSFFLLASWLFYFLEYPSTPLALTGRIYEWDASVGQSTQTRAYGSLSLTAACVAYLIRPDRLTISSLGVLSLLFLLNFSRVLVLGVGALLLVRYIAVNSKMGRSLLYRVGGVLLAGLCLMTAIGYWRSGITSVDFTKAARWVANPVHSGSLAVASRESGFPEWRKNRNNWGEVVPGVVSQDRASTNYVLQKKGYGLGATTLACDAYFLGGWAGLVVVPAVFLSICALVGSARGRMAAFIQCVWLAGAYVALFRLAFYGVRPFLSIAVFGGLLLYVCFVLIPWPAGDDE